MAKKESRRVKTLRGFIKWAEQFDSGQYLFRGVSKENYKIEASASRRLGENGSDPERLLKINKEMIRDARLEGHDLKNGQRLSDLELLAELQHYGAATCLIDFTYSAQVALWMACRQRSKWNVNGKVFAVRSNDPIRFKKVTPESLQENLDYFFTTNVRTGYSRYQWQPKQQNNRIIAQQSIFLFGGAKIEAEADCVILRNSKETILSSLGKSSGITEARMFPDFDGFARLRAHDRLYVEPDAQDYLQHGIAAEQEGRWKEAITYYDEVISSQPDNRLLAEAYYNRGIAYGWDRNKTDQVIEDFTKAIEIKPDYVEAYSQRGLYFYFDKKDLNSAFKDFNKVIELEPDHAEALCFRGTIWLHWQNWKKAKVDLTAAKNRDFDIFSAFGIFYDGFEGFKEDTGVELPEDLRTMLLAAVRQSPNYQH
ncbi:hypothetical protein C6500_13960 [Candidatus Poribacteria bacterium]|nr:MAG: hypothetical protein C6500_13960 [Candidatus Poribacteria bacterium]